MFDSKAAPARRRGARSRALASVAALAMCAAISAPASAALITNGSFESGLAGWTTSGGLGQPDVISSPGWDPQDGNNLIDLNGFAPGFIAQDVSTVVGQQYLLSFALSGNFSNSSDSKEVVVGIDGSDTAYFFAEPAGWATTSMLWTIIQHAFVATDTTTTIAFTSASDGSDAGGHNSEGAALDNIQLNAQLAAVSEPGPLALLGLGLVGVAVRRRHAGA
jgi:hypothetical protein